MTNGEDGETSCGVCELNRYQSRKTMWIECTVCRPGWYHVTCLGLKGAAAQVLRESGSWRCGFKCNSNPRSTVQPILPTDPGEANSSEGLVEPSFNGIRLIERIPKGARHLAATKLADIVDRYTEENTAETWSEMFSFAWLRLYQPEQGGGTGPHNTSLTSKIKDQLNASTTAPARVLHQTEASRLRRKGR